MSGQIYVATVNDEVTPQDGLSYYQCSCGHWDSWGRESLAEHFEDAHEGRGRFAEDWAPAEDLLEEYRRVVEEEVVDLLVQNLEAQAAALRREGKPRSADAHATAALIITENREDWLS